MCGIVGIFNPTQTAANVSLFEQLLYADVFRGYHSTGVFRLDSDEKDTLTYKEATSSPTYLCSKGWEDLKGTVDGVGKELKLSPLYVGHNRHATIGEKTDANAHPFTAGKITMVHNGSVVKSTLSNGSQFDVDSYAVCDLIDKKGIDEALKEMDGAFALVWWNSEDSTLNFLRNDERPLRINRYSDGTYAWASEGDMLDWILSRKGSKSSTVKTLVKSFELPVGMLYSLKLKGKNVIDLGMEKKTLPTFAYSSSYYYNNYSNSHSNRNTSTSYVTQTKAKRHEELLVSAGIDLFNFKGELDKAIVLLENISFTAGYGITGSIDATLAWAEDSLSMLEEVGVEVKGYVKCPEQIAVKAYSIDKKDWDDIKEWDDVYAEVVSVYKTTDKGREVLSFTVNKFTNKIEEASTKNVLNPSFIEFLEIKNEEESKEKDSSKELVVIDKEVKTEDKELDQALTNQSGTQKTIRAIRKVDFNCGLCGDPLDESEYPGTYTWSDGSTICMSCVKYAGVI